mmetsp:Transcript_13901/g.21671  ORF Transcript_13901/g.21671 Transcript_13901/m.21671 type:complete len:120 (+) Transcript_13901:46-405(+)
MAGAAAADFSGRWERDSTKNIPEIKTYLEAHGHDPSTAEEHARAPYSQSWRRVEGDVWEVTTYAADGLTPRRVLKYVIGKFEEPFEGNAIIFGKDAGIAQRETRMEQSIDGKWSVTLPT